MSNVEPPQKPDSPSGGAPHPPRRSKRWWLRITLGLILILVVVVAMGPWIASTSPVRGYVVKQLNGTLNGSVSIADYSVGWMSGASARGVQVFDRDHKLILQIPKFVSKVSLLDVIRGNIDLGDTQLDVRLDDIVVDREGNLNIASIAKPEPHQKAPPHEDQPINLPNIRGSLTVNILGGRISGQGVPQPVEIQPGTISVSIPDINGPISNSVSLAYRVGNGATSSMKLSGTVSAVRGNVVDLEKLTAEQNLTLSNVDLSAATPVARQSMGPDGQLSGILNGSLDVKAQGLTGISALGQLLITDARFAGGGLKDELKLAKIDIPIQVIRTVVDANTTLIKIEKLSVTTPLASADVAGQVTQQSIERLAASQPPGSDGTISLNLNVPDLGQLARAIPNTLRIASDVTVDRGALTASSKLALTSDRITSEQKLDLFAHGTRAGKPIELKPIHVESTASAFPEGKPVPALRDVKLALTSSFATLSGGGPSLAKLGIKGNFDLAKLRGELAQFADLGSIQFAGTGDLSISTEGDPTADGPIRGNVALNIK
ncbi:MAG: hypothetical protein ACREJC_17935, partial [Tepidisphaeraceae bacterium]